MKAFNGWSYSVVSRLDGLFLVLHSEISQCNVLILCGLGLMHGLKSSKCTVSESLQTPVLTTSKVAAQRDHFSSWTFLKKTFCVFRGGAYAFYYYYYTFLIFNEYSVQ